MGCTGLERKRNVLDRVPKLPASVLMHRVGFNMLFAYLVSKNITHSKSGQE